MNHGHDDFAFEAAPGLPAPLPQGESLLWQGGPDWKALAIRAYHVRKVALYFLALVGFSVIFGVVNAHPLHDLMVSCAMLTVLGATAMGVLSGLAYFSSRSTVYTITSRRVLMRHGIAVPMTMNVPLKLIDGAALKAFPNGTGDIAMQVQNSQRVGYLITWPHLRPGYITRPQPSFRALRDAEHAAGILSKALAADAGAAGPVEATETAARVPEPRGVSEPRAAIAGAVAPQPAPHHTGPRSLAPHPAALA